GWAVARGLHVWLADRPGERVTVLCDRFGSREWDAKFRAVLSREEYARVRLAALPDRRYDENDWWRHKEGRVALFNAYLGYGHAALYGEDAGGWREWDPDDYEKS